MGKDQPSLLKQLLPQIKFDSKRPKTPTSETDKESRKNSITSSVKSTEEQALKRSATEESAIRKTSSPRRPSLTVSDFDANATFVTILPAIDPDGRADSESISSGIQLDSAAEKNRSISITSLKSQKATEKVISKNAPTAYKSSEILEQNRTRVRSISSNSISKSASMSQGIALRPLESNASTASSAVSKNSFLDPLVLYDRLTENIECPWRSPLVTDEFYLLDVYYEGDEQLGSQLLAYAKYKSEISLISYDSTSLNELMGDSEGSSGLHTAFSALSLSSNGLLSGNNVQERLRTSQGLSQSPTSPTSSSVTSFPAPLLPKKTMRPTTQTASQTFVSPFRSIAKFNSCSTLFTVDGTLFQAANTPQQLSNTLKAVSHAIMSHVQRTYRLHREFTQHEALNRSQAVLSKRVFRTADKLSEKLHPIWLVRKITDEVLKHPFIMQPPTTQEVYTFLKQIFAAADLSTEIAIISLIYLERMLYATRVTLHGINLFRAILGALMLASKIWDDQAVWNVDFKSIMPDLVLEDLNQMECWWLKKVNYNVQINRADYAKYWFAIRELSERLSGVKVGDVNMTIKARSDWHLNPQAAAILHPASLQSPSSPQRSMFSHSTNALNSETVPRALTELDMKRISVNTINSKLKASISQAINMNTEVSEDSELAHQESRSRHSKQAYVDSDQNSLTKEEYEMTVLKPLKREQPSTEWGASQLRRAKSDHLYQASAPPASVL